MIFTDRTITVEKGASSINDTIVLYRGDKEVEIRFTLNEGSPFRFGSGASPNIIEKTEAAYGQLIIKRPNNLPAIFSEIVPTNEGKIIFTITAEMIDEITEVGNYTFQIRLFDENRESRATLPEVVNGIEIREPIATEDVSTTNEVGVATVGYALTTADTSEDAFDSQGNYNKTTWVVGDRITDAKLNKIEAGIDSINKKANNIPTRTSQLENDSDYATITQVNQAIDNAQLGGGGSNINDTTASANTTYSSNKIESIKDNLSSQIEEIANNRITTDQIKSVISSMITSGEINTDVNFRDVIDGEIFTTEEITLSTEIYVSTNNLTINENATSTFDVKLYNQPASNITITLSVNNEYCTIDKTTLVFTPNNYSTVQTVTVTGSHYQADYTDKLSLITLTSSDNNAVTVSVTIKNIDAEGGGSSPQTAFAETLAELMPNYYSASGNTLTINRNYSSAWLDVPVFGLEEGSIYTIKHTPVDSSNPSKINYKHPEQTAIANITKSLMSFKYANQNIYFSGTTLPCSTTVELKKFEPTSIVNEEQSFLDNFMLAYVNIGANSDYFVNSFGELTCVTTDNRAITSQELLNLSPNTSYTLNCSKGSTGCLVRNSDKTNVIASGTLSSSNPISFTTGSTGSIRILFNTMTEKNDNVIITLSKEA